MEQLRAHGEIGRRTGLKRGYGNKAVTNKTHRRQCDSIEISCRRCRKSLTQVLHKPTPKPRSSGKRDLYGAPRIDGRKPSRLQTREQPFLAVLNLSRRPKLAHDDKGREPRAGEGRCR